MSCYSRSAGAAALAAHRAIDLNPSFALGHLVLGMARLFDGDARRAIAPLEHGLTLKPNDPQNVAWYILLADAQLLDGQPNRALDSAKRALAVRPIFRLTFEALVCCAVALGDLNEARRRELDGPESSFIARLNCNNPDYERCIKQILGTMGP